MTNAVVQNNENNQDINISALLSNKKSDNLQIRQNENFSNLLNNLSARTQKAQTNFVQKAVKSNTSSINKKALSNNSDSSVKVGEDTSKLNSKGNSEPIKNNKPERYNNVTEKKVVREQKDSSLVKKEETSVKQDFNNVSSKEVQTKDIPSQDIEENNINKKTESQSDINNSSLVESSPVFLSEDVNESADNVDSLKDTESFINVLPLPVNIQNQSQVEDLVKKTEDIISQIQTIDDAVNAVEDISSLLDNSTLSQDEKNSIYEMLNEIQNSISNSSLSSDFSNLVEKINDIVVEFEKIQQNSLNLSSSSLGSVDEVIDSEFNKLNDILNDLKNILNSKDINKVDEAIETVDKIQEILISDTEKSADLTEDMKIAVDDLKSIFDDIKKVLDSNNSDIKGIQESLKNILNAISMNLSSDNENSLEVIDNSILKDSLNDLSELNEKLNDIDFSKLKDISELDKNLMKDILKVFNDFQDNSSELNLSDEIKLEMKQIIEQMDNNELLDNVSVEDFRKISEKISQIQVKLNDELKKSFPEVENVETDEMIKVSNKSVDLNNIQSEPNVIDATGTFKNLSQNSEFSNNQYKNNQPDQFENDNIKVSDVSDFNVESNEEMPVEENLSVDKNAISEHEQKLISEIKEDILLDIDYGSIPEKSGALSVSDEVIKLAMDDVGVLKTDTTIKGSLLYDTASGNASVIKNAAQLIKGAQTSQNPILNQLENSDLMNQIGDKLTQLKDNGGQKLTMVLRPNDLGRLSIELTSNNLGLTTNILAQNEDVRQYIEKNIHTLRQQLTDAGISVNNIQIKTAGQEGSTNYQGNQGFEENNNSGQNNQQNSNNNERNEKEKQETLLAMSNYDYRFAKDFSSVMNKTISYDLN